MVLKYKIHKTITPEEWNNLIDEFEDSRIDYNINQISLTSAQIETNSTIFECSLTGRNSDIINVGTICSQFYKIDFDKLINKYGYTEIETGVDKIKIKWNYEVAYGYQYTNDYYSRKWLKCWSYDINSAFAYAMLKPMPDTTKEPRYNDIIKKGEMGFYKLGGATTKEGEYADIIFPLIDSPFKEYIYKYYEKKQNASDKIERKKWKNFLNIPTGMLARKNIFLRNAVIYYSNEYIKQFIDDNTVYCNVDCIVSLVPRYDLPLGENIGQFKEEHKCDDFKYIKPCEYQWGEECHYSGIPRGLLKDIEFTTGWTKNIKYILDGRKIILNEKEKQNN